MKEKLLDYLKTFMLQSNWEDGKTSEQARAIFTTICFVGCIDADTSECDAILAHLYVKTAMDEIMDYDEFEAYMIKLIV